MAWRGLHLTEPARLALGDGQMVVARAEGEVRLALEDLAWVVIDTPQVSLSSALLASCMEAGVALLTTDPRHTPNGLLLPFHRHHRQAEVAAWQVNASAPLRKRLWQIMVRAKIANQAATLERCGGDGTALRAMARLVGSGDTDNVEARAARAYWAALFPAFVRDNAADKRNKLLNYGYAVIRAAVARGAVAAGLLPALGLHHASAANAFNLADDLVEPFRPFVDAVVWELSAGGTQADGEASLPDRRVLAAIPTREARLERERMTLLSASEMVAESLVRALETGSTAALRLPAPA